MQGEKNLSENQFGFRKGRATIDAIQAEVDFAMKGKSGTVLRGRISRIDQQRQIKFVQFQEMQQLY